MTTEETAMILAMVTETYPAFRKDRNPQVTAKIWQRIFQNTPYAMVENALITYIATDTKGFPPQPGALNALIAESMRADEPTEDEAWAMVLKAISRGLYNSREEFDKLSREIQRIVGSPQQIHDWAYLDCESVHTVIASNFKRNYRRRMAQIGTPSFRGMLPEDASEEYRRFIAGADDDA